MKINTIEIAKVKNGYILRIFSFEHNEESAKFVEIYSKLDDVLNRAKLLYEIGEI